MKRVRVRPALIIMVFVFAQAVVGAHNAVDDSLAIQAASRPSIIETLAVDSDFTLLVEAISLAGLAEMLAIDGPFTILAPNDSAFVGLGKDAVDRIFKNRKNVKQFMAGLIIIREYDTEALLDAEAVATIDKREIAVSKKDKQITVGDAVIIGKDIKCSNGIIQIVDAVPSPPAEEETSSIP